MKVIVKKLDGSEQDVEFRDGDSVQEAKIAIEECMGCPPEEQVLTFQTSPLRDNGALLKDVGVQEGSVLTLMIRDCPPEDLCESVTADEAERWAQNGDRSCFHLPRIALRDGGTICSSGCFHKEQNPARLFDGSKYSKFYTWADEENNHRWQKGGLATTRQWVMYTPLTPMSLKGYTFTSADDDYGRDPKDWVLEGRVGEDAWEVLDEQKGVMFDGRHQDITIPLPEPSNQEYTAFRFRFLEMKGGQDYLQLARIQWSP